MHGRRATGWAPHPDAALEQALATTPPHGLRSVLAHPSVQVDPFARLRVLDRLHDAFPGDNAIEQAWMQHMLIGHRADRVWQAIADWPAPAALDRARLLLSAQVAQIVSAHDQARERYGLALQRDPDDIDALQKSIEAGAAGVRPDDAATRLRRLHDDARDAYVREKAAFSLATLLDGEAPAEAFVWATRAHALKRRRVGAWDRDAFARRLARDRHWTPSPPATDPNPLRPVFVLGLPRSGTTLLTALLEAHGAIAAAGEQNLVPTLADGPCREAATVDVARRRFCADWYRAALADIAGEARIIVDKLPANAAHVGLILALFPDALVLHARRAPRDTAISIWQHDFEFGCLFGDDPDDLEHHAHALDAHLAHWQALAPERVLTVAYEDVVADAAAALAPALSTLGLHWHDGMAEFWTRGRSIGTHSESQLREPINARSIERWRRYLPAAEAFVERF